MPETTQTFTSYFTADSFLVGGVFVSGSTQRSPPSSRAAFGPNQELPNPKHETLARFLATPPSSREIPTMKALAEKLEVSRNTLYEWQKNTELMKRADWLSASVFASARLTARRHYRTVVRMQARLAMAGDTRAAIFIQKLMFAENKFLKDEKTRAGRSVQGNTEKPFRPENELANPQHEALARFLATPDALREISTLSAVAEALGVSRNTLYEWQKNPELMKRAHWLSSWQFDEARLLARRYWEAIVEAQVEAALVGSAQAAEFIQSVAWEENRDEGTEIRVEISLEEALELQEAEEIIEVPEWEEGSQIIELPSS